MLTSLPIPADAARSWALFLDVDGTLVGLAEHPDAVTVPEGLATLLRRLRESLSGALALISGRSLSSLDALLGGAELDAAGCHGAEIRLGRQIKLFGDAQADIPRVTERLIQLSSEVPMTLVEVKSRSVAFHYRNSALTDVAARQLATMALDGTGERLRLLDGKRIVEILAHGVDKGEAIAYFLGHPPFTGRVPVFVGDDVTDERGFDEVNRRGGISVHVGENVATAARYRVGSAADFVAWLNGPLCRSLGCDTKKEPS